MSDTIDLYSNSVNVASSLYDITLFFLINQPILTDKKTPPVMEAKEVCKIRMSPQHAKALASVLIQQIDEYEKQFKIKLPLEPNLLDTWNKYIKKVRP